MATKRSSGQYELVLENRQLVFILFGAVLLCGIFFTLGFLVGHEQRDLSLRNDASKQEGEESTSPTNKAAMKKEAPTPDSSKPKKADQNAINKELTFYKTVEGKSAGSPRVNPKEEASSRENGKNQSSSQAATEPTKTKPAVTPPTLTNTIIYQIAALSKSDDAQALVRKLKEKGFQAFLVSPPADSGSDKLYRVQVGPFSDSNLAEQIKAKLVASGYTPITKK